MKPLLSVLRRHARLAGALLALLACITTAGAEASRVPTVDRFVAAINAGDADALGALLDAEALAARVIRGLVLDAKVRRDYLKVLGPQFSQYVRHYGAQLAAQKATARRMPAPGAGAALVRITTRDRSGNHAHNYLRLDTDDQGRIVDWYDHALAQPLSQQLVQQSRTVLSPAQAAQLYVGQAHATAEVAELLAEVAMRTAVGDFRSAHAKLLTMPQSVRQYRVFATLRVAMARHVSVDAYREALSALARHHGDDDDLQFILIDHYLLDRQFAQALGTIDRAARLLGNDEVMEANRCAALTELKRKTDAIAACDRAIALNTAFETPRWTRVRIGLLTEDAALAIASLTGVETAQAKRLDARQLAAMPYYAWLVKQPEWIAWAAERSGEPVTRGAR